MEIYAFDVKYKYNNNKIINYNILVFAIMDIEGGDNIKNTDFSKMSVNLDLMKYAGGIEQLSISLYNFDGELILFFGDETGFISNKDLFKFNSQRVIHRNNSVNIINEISISDAIKYYLTIKVAHEIEMVTTWCFIADLISSSILRIFKDCESKNGWESHLRKVRNEYSKTEIKVILNLLMGKNDKEISDTLFISVPSVRKHFSSIFYKSRTRSKLEFVLNFYSKLYSNATENNLKEFII